MRQANPCARCGGAIVTRARLYAPRKYCLGCSYEALKEQSRERGRRERIEMRNEKGAAK